MGSKIVQLIFDKLKNKDKKVCELFSNDPFFRSLFKVLHQCGDDKPELILNIIIALCESRKEIADKLIKVAQERG
jgi:hypothetical protein